MKNKGRFKKGQVPWNKDKKMDPETYEKVSKSFFPKGHIPENAKYFGNPYLIYRQTKKGHKEERWMIYHNGKRRGYLGYLCEQNNIDMTGKVPALKLGFNIENEPVFEDIIIRTKEENIKLHSYNRYPKEIRKLTQLLGVFTRQINKRK